VRVKKYGVDSNKGFMRCLYTCFEILRRESPRPIDGFIFVRRSGRRFTLSLSQWYWRRCKRSREVGEESLGIVPKYRSEQIMSD